MKIGIFTFHYALNYGAVLQAFGLKEYLKSLGHEVHIIDYRPSYLSRQHRLFQMDKYPPMSFITKVKMFVRECFILPTRVKRNRKFNQFCQKYLDLDKLDLDNEYNDYDFFIFGSDQIWNSRITTGCDAVFWGDFLAAKNKKTISYAASAGSISNIDTADVHLSKWVSNFAALSVREKSLAAFLKEKFCRDSALVLDPVLMAGVTYFDKISAHRKRNPYLLLFLIVENEKVRRVAKQIANKRGLEIVEVLSMQETLRGGVHMALSPEEFLGYIKYADYVVTPSFHGTAFSILFEREFVTVAVEKNNDERSFYLLRSLGLEDRYVISESNINVKIIDYNSVREKYIVQQKFSRKFLTDFVLNN